MTSVRWHWLFHACLHVVPGIPWRWCAVHCALKNVVASVALPPVCAVQRDLIAKVVVDCDGRVRLLVDALHVGQKGRAVVIMVAVTVADEQKCVYHLMLRSASILSNG